MSGLSVEDLAFKVKEGGKQAVLGKLSDHWMTCVANGVSDQAKVCADLQRMIAYRDWESLANDKLALLLLDLVVDEVVVNNRKISLG